MYPPVYQSEPLTLPMRVLLHLAGHFSAVEPARRRIPCPTGPLEGKLDERQEDMLRVGTALRNIGWLRCVGEWGDPPPPP